MYFLLLSLLASLATATPLVKARRSNAIANKWIIKLKDNVATMAVDGVKAALSTEPDYQYSMPGFRGFAGTLSDEEVALLQASDQIEYIQQDAQVYTTALVKQLNATWGISRISHTKPSEATYLYDSSVGEGTCAYVIDTGVDITHPEFQGRAFFLADLTHEGNFIDGYGHGTHVAGTIGSATWGVAKKTAIFAVRVLDSNGSGTNADVIAGMEFILRDARERRGTDQCRNGFVVNISLGSEKLPALNDAAAAMVAEDIFLGVAAGNDGVPADDFSPGSEPSVCTVGATAPNDTLTSWSNHGPRIDILAPGLDITSTLPNGVVDSFSGTSMAAPHVVGLAAYLLGLGSPSKDLCGTIAALAIKNAIDQDTLPKGTPNLLAFNGADASQKRMKHL
ncbi:hypothetical protein COCCADRAFT_38791 [Bipolaris zeicola 26-R-13]|uniref:Peptidase S8/S53 domain-containing protein n=1 Tax=Cochliobolus carbonum (strain 26-R-13) TaxID=930089 RepID=W6YI79_COCC2|nr:uncharacterized protein COCCADRAFT_38791 [Bipolaris zeicola 26-R-13]EUC31046.1 hypothetical protein COCCADRAFT_38791 [Bipolaris zeicola 26-R-13]